MYPLLYFYRKFVSSGILYGSDSLTRDQLAALRTCLHLLQDGAPTEAAIEASERQLMAAGLPPIGNGSASLAKLYMGEL